MRTLLFGTLADEKVCELRYKFHSGEIQADAIVSRPGGMDFTSNVKPLAIPPFVHG